MIDETLFDAEEKMEKAVGSPRTTWPTLRTGRANPNMFARILVDYYGAPTPMTQMATIQIPEARMAVIKPYDGSQLHAIEKAIRDSDLGVNPSDRRHRAAGGLPAADRGAATRPRQDRPGEGRGRQGVDPQHAPQGQGDARQAGQGRRGRRGRRDQGREGTAGDHRPLRRSVDELVKHKEAELLEV